MSSEHDALTAIARAHRRPAGEVLLVSDRAAVLRALGGDAVLSGVGDGSLADERVALGADGGHDVDGILAAARGGRTIVVASPAWPTGRPLDGAQLDRLAAGIPRGAVLVLDESRSEFASSPRAAFASDLLGSSARGVPAGVVVLRDLPSVDELSGVEAAYALGDASALGRLSAARAALDQVAHDAIAGAVSPEGLDRLDERVEWIKAERQRIERTLRDRMERAEIEGRRSIAVAHSDADAVWLPVGDRADELARLLADEHRVDARAVSGFGVVAPVADEAANDRLVDAVTAWATA